MCIEAQASMSINAKPCRLDQHQSCQPIMLSLSACFGVHAKQSNKLLVFAKMSNAYLGVLDKPRVNIQNVVRVVRDMQQQVSKLLRHPDLPSKFMLLFAPELLVEPRFIFSDYVSCKRANQMVDYVNKATIIHAMWSEDDQDAKDYLRTRGYNVQSYPNYKQVEVFSAQIIEYLPQEFWVYNFPSKVKQLVFHRFFKGGLNMFPWLESLTLYWFEDNIDLETTLQNAATLRTFIVHAKVPYQSLVSSKPHYEFGGQGNKSSKRCRHADTLGVAEPVRRLPHDFAKRSFCAVQPARLVDRRSEACCDILFGSIDWFGRTRVGQLARKPGEHGFFQVCRVTKPAPPR